MRDGFLCLVFSLSFLVSGESSCVLPVGSFGCQSTSRHGTWCCFLAQPWLNCWQKTQVRTDMRRRQKKRTESTEDNNDVLTLLRLQQHVLQLTTAKTALEDIQRLVHETALYNFTSAQDRRTLNTAQCCLNSLRIRIEAQVNSVEETVKQRQLSLSPQLRKETSRTSAAPEGILARSNQYPYFQTSNDAHSTHLLRSGSGTTQE